MKWGRAGLRAGRCEVAPVQRSYDYTPLYDGDFSGTALAGKNLAASGLVDREVTSIINGQYYYGAIYKPSAVIAAINAARAANGSGVSATDLLQDDKRGRETLWAGLFARQVRRQALRRDCRGARRAPQDPQCLLERRRRQQQLRRHGQQQRAVPAQRHGDLPANGKLVVRGALWTGYSPPEYGYLSSRSERDAWSGHQ